MLEHWRSSQTDKKKIQTALIKQIKKLNIFVPGVNDILLNDPPPPLPLSISFSLTRRSRVHLHQQVRPVVLNHIVFVCHEFLLVCRQIISNLNLLWIEFSLNNIIFNIGLKSLCSRSVIPNRGATKFWICNILLIFNCWECRRLSFLAGLRVTKKVEKHCSR